MLASPLVTFGMLGLAVVVAAAFVWAERIAVERTGGPAWPSTRKAAIAALWMGLWGVLAASGLIARFELRPPPLALVLLATFGLSLGLAFSRLGLRFATGIPLAWLVLSQAFRLPLELIMHAAATEGVMPMEMSYEGYNFDILSGITALLVGALALGGRAPRWLLLTWNVLGSGLLVTIISVAMLATPIFHAFGNEPSHLNTWVAHFPFVWLPTVLVANALFTHVVLFRALARAPRVGNPAT